VVSDAEKREAKVGRILVISKYSIKCFLQRLSPAVNWIIGFSLQQFSIFIRLK